VTVLSPLFVDKAPAFASVEGIKTLVNCLGTSSNDAVIALAADCIARLAHTRAGTQRQSDDLLLADWPHTQLLNSAGSRRIPDPAPTS